MKRSFMAKTSTDKWAPEVWIFASDEGFGHVVRQEAIIKNLLNRFPKAKITFQTSAKLETMKEKLGNRISYRDRYNNLNTLKTPSGGLDLERSLEVLQSYPSRASQ